MLEGVATWEWCSALGSGVMVTRGQGRHVMVYVPSCLSAAFFWSIGDEVLETGPLPRWGTGALEATAAEAISYDVLEPKQQQ